MITISTDTSNIPASIEMTSFGDCRLFTGNAIFEEKKILKNEQKKKGEAKQFFLQEFQGGFRGDRDLKIKIEIKR